jgi:hypothetical protein
MITVHCALSGFVTVLVREVELGNYVIQIHHIAQIRSDLSVHTGRHNIVTMSGSSLRPLTSRHDTCILDCVVREKPVQLHCHPNLKTSPRSTHKPAGPLGPWEIVHHAFISNSSCHKQTHTQEAQILGYL